MPSQPKNHTLAKFWATFPSKNERRYYLRSKLTLLAYENHLIKVGFNFFTYVKIICYFDNCKSTLKNCILDPQKHFENW